MPEMIMVEAVCDPEAGIWLVESSDVPGLNLEGETLQALVEKLPGAILDLLELDPETENAMLRTHRLRRSLIRPRMLP